MRVELALTDDAWRRGLAGRRALGPDRGMLFVGARDRAEPFWNAETFVPLSLAYLAADGTIQEIHDMHAIGETQRPVAYPPSRPYRHALEVPRGWFAAAGLGPGSRVFLGTP